MSAFDLIRFTLGGVIWFGICGLALWRGGWPERTAAASILTSAFASPLAQAHIHANDPDFGVFVLDFALLIILVAVALRSDRWWPLFAAAFILLAVVTHLALMLDESIVSFTYVTATTLWGYMAVFALGGGVWEIERRRRRARTSPSQ